MPLDSVEVEHFDPQLKNTSSDNIQNWHAVIRWMNSHKARKVENFRPLPDLARWDPERVRFEDGEFVCDENDTEADNLIRFLGVNKPEVFDHRAKHVARIKKILQLVGWDTASSPFFKSLQKKPLFLVR